MSEKETGTDILVAHIIKSIEEVYDKVKSDNQEFSSNLSSRFWDEYEAVKNYKVKGKSTSTENSLQQKSLNNLKYLLRLNNNSKLTELKPFIRVLLEDILDYGTLSDYTLRRLSNLNIDKHPDKTIKEFNALQKELGSNYLYNEKTRLKDLSKEIIIAVENQK